MNAQDRTLARKLRRSGIIGMERNCRRICGSAIPKGLRNKAQGCEERPTLGVGPNGVQLQRGCGRAEWSLPRRNPFRVVSDSRTFSQGSSFLATLGFVAESLWDSDS